MWALAFELLRETAGGVIFAPDMIPLIRERRKVQTRRPVDGKLPCRYKPGRLYRVQPGRGKPGVFQITVIDVRSEALGEIDQRDARREGFQFVAQFQDRWRELHGSWTPELEVWVISFAVGDLRDRFDQPRLLARSPGRAGETAEQHQDYVTEPRLAMAGEAEAVDAKSAERFAAEGYAGHARRKQTEVRRQHVRSLAIRLKDAERRKDGEAVKALIPELQSLAAQLGAAA